MFGLHWEALEQRIGLRRDATRAQVRGPEWQGGGFDTGAPKLQPRRRRILAYCGRKMVLTMGSPVHSLPTGNACSSCGSLYPSTSGSFFVSAEDPGTTMPSWRSGNTHGFCVTEGHPPIASEPTPSLRLWATAPGATPALRIEHITGGRTDHSKPERSTLLESGTFYFALTGPLAWIAAGIQLDSRVSSKKDRA